MIIYDFEVFKHDWMICWIDCETKKRHSIVNDKALFEKFYEHYKNRIWVGYNSRNFDQWIAKAILCDFNPYEMSQWIIEKDRKGHEFSKLLSKFPIMNYDCMVGFRGLKELEAFMGHDIQETSVPFNIDRKLTAMEIESVKKYCYHDVNETLHVFVETADEFNSHFGLITEFKMPIWMISKTSTQLSAEILGAVQTYRDDEFDIQMPNDIILGKYEYIKDHYMNWSRNIRDYKQITLETVIAGVKHTLGVGGIHGAIEKYMGDGIYIMADVESYYPAGMINKGFLSRNIKDPTKFRKIRDTRVVLKKAKDPRQACYKLVINKVFGGSKDQYNKLYDPLQANNLCISNQLYLVDLIEKLEGKCQLIQSNTDGILVKLFHASDEEMIMGIMHEWENRTGFKLEFDKYCKVFQKDVNNYIITPFGDLYDSKGKERFKRKGAYAKKLSLLDNDLPIVNKALVDYFVHNTPVEKTVMESDKMMDFQCIVKASGKYEYAFKESLNGTAHIFYREVTKTRSRGGIVTKYKEQLEEVVYGKITNEKVHRCFASVDKADGGLYKKHKEKTALDKIGGTPNKCKVINCDITEMKVPSWVDRQWYIDLAKQRIKDFVN